MSNKKGPFILFLFILIFLLAAYFGKDILFKERQKNTSDTVGDTKTLVWAGDGYLGYAFLHTVEMKKQLARQGISLDFINDDGDYAKRLKEFSDKKYDFIVLPVNSYIEHGAKYKYPGVIVSAICESKGADAIVGFEDVMPNGKINDLNNSDLLIYYTPKSPSSFLLDLTISDFALEALQENNSWRREVAGSGQVYGAAERAVKDRSVGDAFVMWEPEVTKAISKLGLKKLWGSDQFNGYIIDVIVFHRDIVSKKEEMVKNFLKTYFRTINFYSAREDLMIKEFSKIASINKDVVKSMIDNIDWYNLNENCSQLFDIPVAIGMPSHDGIINSIYACSNVMVRVGSINDDVSDPYLLINSKFLEEIKTEAINAVGTTKGQAAPVFNELSEGVWKNLPEIGIMRVNPITFQSGANMLDYQGEEIVDKVAQMLINNYPEYRVIIRGHTGTGDEAANTALSKSRAEVVKQRLIAVHNIDQKRLRAEGMGASQPPKKKPGENQRAYYLRWARVEFVLVENNSL